MPLQTLMPIRLEKKKTGLAALIEKKTFLGRAARVITSPKTTLVLAATLGSLLFPGAAATAARGVGKSALGFVKKRPVTALFGAGVLATSPTAREFLVKAPERIFTGGRKVGKIIEDPSKAEDILGIREKKTLKEKAIGGLKAAGIVGLGIGAVVGAKTLLEKRKEQKALDQLQAPRGLGFTEPRQVGLGGIPVGAPQIRPTGAPGEAIARPPIQNIIQIQVQ